MFGGCAEANDGNTDVVDVADVADVADVDDEDDGLSNHCCNASIIRCRLRTRYPSRYRSRRRSSRRVCWDVGVSLVVVVEDRCSEAREWSVGV